MSAEYHFLLVFPAVETEALPIYHLITKSIQQNAMCDRAGLLESLAQINVLMRNPLKIYYDTMIESKISRDIWLRYVQGFQGWAAGTIDPITGQYDEYDGLSGNQLLFSHVIDAFLGLDPYLSDENSLRYIPENQRKFSKCIREYNFREQAKQNGDKELEKEMQGVVRQMRAFRAVHRARIRPYLNVAAPERLIMTAGKSVLETEEIKEVEVAIAPLDAMLEKRLNDMK